MLLCPSLMCADYGNLRATVEDLDAAGIDIFHCDVMDGSFVPNFAMASRTSRPCELPPTSSSTCTLWSRILPARLNFSPPPARTSSISIRSPSVTWSRHSPRLSPSARAPVSPVNPDTSISEIEEMLNLCDYVMVMTVNPGFAGQSFIEFTNDKVRRLAALKERFGFKLMIDGACSPERVRDLSAIGADGFILGTSALFGKDAGYEECLRRLRAGEVY